MSAGRCVTCCVIPISQKNEEQYVRGFDSIRFKKNASIRFKSDFVKTGPKAVCNAGLFFEVAETFLLSS